jgi:hypothetical protein
MHTTWGRRFISILDNEEISTGPKDTIINREVSFHFYGKPSYRPKPTGTYSKKLSSALFCVVLDYNNLPPPSSILPFDSGGYSERYAVTCDNINIEEFYLPSDQEAPLKLVAALFGSNNNYWSMALRPGVENEISKLDFHSSSLLNLCQLPGPVNFDQRALSIELHYDVPIKLSGSNVLAIVAPDIACEEREIIDFAARFSADLLDYPLELEDSQSQQRQIRDRVYKWMVATPRFGIA